MNDLDVDNIKCVEDIFKEFETFKENRYIAATNTTKTGENNFTITYAVIYQIDTDNMRYMHKPVFGDDLSYKWSDGLQLIREFVVKPGHTFNNPYFDYDSLLTE